MTDARRAAVVTAAVLATAAGLGGCAQTSKLLSYLHIGRSEKPALAIRPAETPVAATPPAPVQDRLYRQAKAAIEARDYAGALELLQLAKQGAPQDGRILNAMGVVYDKLGRFDLSQRYYQQALALEPNSPAVLANLKYSSKLQAYSTQLQVAPPTSRALAAAAPPAPGFKIVTPATTVRLASNSPMLGSAVRIVDASGGMALAQGVERHLVAKGWSVEAAEPQRVASAATVIVFKAEHRRVAEALAHTLPFRATLQPCAHGCEGVRLVVGANARIQGRG